jgi:site-specific recombinase XerD
MSERPLFGGKSPKALPWKPLPHMEEWLDNLHADGTSTGYINAARAGLAHFSNFLAGEGIQHPDEITRHHILRFQAHLTTLRKQNGDPLALSYRQQLVKYVGAWINWCAEVEHIERSPWVRIKVGRVAKQPKPLEDEEVARLFDAHRQMAFTISPFFYHRREVILVVLYAWGLRIGELEALTVTAMDMRLDYVTSRNKSRAGSANSTKTLPYSDEMKQVVGRWLRIRSTKAKIGEDALLIDHSGKPLNQHAIRKIITELGRRAGVDVNPHRLRDTFGTTMLDNDVPVERIQKMMGHTRREQTLAYSRVNDPKIKESHDAVMNPLIKTLLGGKVPHV